MSNFAMPVLQLQDATVLAGPGGPVLMKHINLRLDPGDILLVRAEAGEEAELLLDVCEGMVPVDSGECMFAGDHWVTMTASQRYACRSRIGRVSQAETWINSLDVHDNVLLAQQHHHGERKVADLYAEALGYARAVGLKDLPRRRPEEIGHTSLRKYQWVRACMGSPALLLLERPALDVHLGDIPKLMDLVCECSQRGAAVLWLTSERSIVAHPKLESARKAVLQRGRLTMEGVE
jgi:phospholipid/cholesterol/gamma-HCH transport system ATP-binding protein